MMIIFCRHCGLEQHVTAPAEDFRTGETSRREVSYNGYQDIWE
jgi:hypothetical protein